MQVTEDLERSNQQPLNSPDFFADSPKGLEPGDNNTGDEVSEDDEEVFEPSLLAELVPNYRDVLDDAFAFVMEEYQEITTKAMALTLNELGAEEDEELEAHRYAYLSGIASVAERLLPECIEMVAIAGFMVEENDKLSEGLEFHNHVMKENSRLQERVNELEREDIIRDECRDLTLTQQTEIKSFLDEQVSTTMNLSDYRSKVRRLKMKYYKKPRTGLHDPLLQSKPPSHNPMMSAANEYLRKTKR